MKYLYNCPYIRTNEGARRKAEVTQAEVAQAFESTMVEQPGEISGIQTGPSATRASARLLGRCAP